MASESGGLGGGASEGIGALFGGIASLAGVGGEGGMPIYKEMFQLVKDLKNTDPDVRALAAAKLKQVAEVNPALYKAIVPEGYQGIQEDPRLKEAQLQSLQGMQRVAQEGLPTEDRILAGEAQRAMNQAQTRGINASLMNLSERGRLSGGAELQARLAAGQQSSEMGASFGRDLQKLAIQNRLNAMDQSSQMAGNIRGQDLTAQQSAAQIANRFNEFVSTMQNQAAQNNAQNTQQARMANTQSAQGISNQNQMLDYQNRIRNQEYPNAMRQQGYENELSKLGILIPTANKYAFGLDAEKQGKINAITGLGQGIGAAGSLFASGGFA